MTPCIYCGKPTDGNFEFLTMRERRRVHIACMRAEGERKLESGVWDASQIITGKQAREGKAKKPKAP